MGKDCRGLDCAMEKIVRQGLLDDFYGSLLSGRQKKVYEELVYNDMSLTEISEEEGITRQAASGLIQRATEQMEEYEKTLGLIARFDAIRSVCDRMKQTGNREDAAFAEEILKFL